jgi:DtxR family transcriptional regulator, Mn-dependent transcriptional regulator
MSSIADRRAHAALTASREDYLREMYMLTADGREITTQALASRMRVAPVSVTQMLRRLSILQLIEHVPYQSVALTQAGRAVAREIVERHDLIEDYLVHVLGFRRDAGHDEADRLEHVVSDELIVRLRACVESGSSRSRRRSNSDQRKR